MVQVVAGAFHTCATHRDGTISCWGLGESIDGSGATLLPPRTVTMAGTEGLHVLSAGRHQTCAMGDREVRCWGNRSFPVVKEDGLTALMGSTAVAVGPGFGCAAGPEGVHCWGGNEMGQLGRPLELTDSPRALLALGGAQRLLGAGQAVVAYDGTSLCAWGSNASKQVADDDTNTIVPTPRCTPMADVGQVVVGGDHVCVRRGGAFACWGERYYGQLGIGGTVDDTLDVPPHGAVTRLPRDVVSLAAGASHTCALVADGRVFCFGRNHLGQMGTLSAAEEVRDPVEVTGLAGGAIAIGSGSSAHHTCAVLETGKLQCWGANGDGQLGDAPATRDAARFSTLPLTVQF